MLCSPGDHSADVRTQPTLAFRSWLAFFGMLTSWVGQTKLSVLLVLNDRIEIVFPLETAECTGRAGAKRTDRCAWAII